jgi:DNA-binding transcriptional LysR family regulator
MGVDPRIAFEAHDYHEAQAMVAVGVGVALAP